MPAGATEGHANNAAGLISPAAALGSNPGHAQPAEAPQQYAALTPEEDKIPLAMMAGVTPAKPPRVWTCALDCLDGVLHTAPSVRQLTVQRLADF